MKTTYMVTYFDDKNKKHITFVKNLTAVKFIQDRFGKVLFEPTGNFCQAIV